MDTFLDITGIVKRAKQVLNLKNNTELAAYLGVSHSTLFNWIKRNSMNFPLVLNKMKDVDYNWLLTGKGSPEYQPEFCECECVEEETEEIHNMKRNRVMRGHSVSLYNLNANTNLKTLLANKQQYAVGKIHLPGTQRCDGAIQITGDSMYPILKSGDIVGFKEISSFKYVIFGEMYLVSFTMGGNEYMTVKYVNRSQTEGHIKLVSYNTYHEPIDLPVCDINAMAIVKFSIRKNMMT